MDLLTRQLTELQWRRPGARFETAPDGQRVLVVPDVAIGSAWNLQTVTIRIVVAAGYPHVTLDCFYTEAELRLASGGEPMNSSIQAVLGGPVSVVLVARRQLGPQHRDPGSLRPPVRGALAGGPMTHVLEAPDTLWQTIRNDLLSTPHLERAAVGFAGLRGDGSGRRLLLRDWVPVPTDEYLVQLAYHLEVSPTFWARHAKRVRQSGEALIVLHSHPSDSGVPSFSPSDDGGEARLIPKIHARAAVPVAAVVLSPGGHQARITEPDRGGRQLDIHIAGRPRTAGSRHVAGERFDRQLRALGQKGQATLAALSIGVVGAGGLGSHVIQQLVHLGVGRIVVVDPDRVAPSNLSRLVGASRFDAIFRRPKTRVARRLARRVGGPTQVIEVVGSVTDEGPARGAPCQNDRVRGFRSATQCAHVPTCRRCRPPQRGVSESRLPNVRPDGPTGARRSGDASMDQAPDRLTWASDSFSAT